MNLSNPRDLGRHVVTRVDGARVDRLWNTVAGRAPTRRTGWRLPAMAAVSIVAVAAIVAIVRLRDHVAPPLPRQQVVEYDHDGSMTLADGSRIVLGAGAKVRLERFDEAGVEVTLEEGDAEFRVTHVASRPFVVHAGRFDVVDIGTRFDVLYTPPPGSGATRVDVSEGRVEVRDGRGELPARAVVAGESWSSAPEPKAAPSAAASSRTADTAAPSSSAAGTAAPSAGVPSSAATSTPQRVAVPSARALLQIADAARVANHPSDAAAALDTLRRHHRSDPRAGLAAFELGRLRLDSLGDARGAIEAFDDAIALAPKASFREDAEARRVEAMDRARDARCTEARDNYLSRYPSGLHAAEVRARCAP